MCLHKCTNKRWACLVLLFGETDWGPHGIRESLISLFQSAKRVEFTSQKEKCLVNRKSIRCDVAVFGHVRFTDYHCSSRICSFRLTLKCSLSIAVELIALIPSINRFITRNLLKLFIGDNWTDAELDICAPSNARGTVRSELQSDYVKHKNTCTPTWSPHRRLSFWLSGKRSTMYFLQFYKSSNMSASYARALALQPETLQSN